MYLGNTTVAGTLGVTGAVSNAGTISGGFVYGGLDASVTANGSTQGTAYPVTKQVTIVTAAAAGTGLVLPAGAAGLCGEVINAGANPITLYPSGSNTLNGQAAGVGVVVPAPGSARWFYNTSTQGFVR